MLHQLLVHEPVIYRHWYVWSRSYQQDKVFCYKSSALVGRAGISHFSSLTYGLRLGIRNCRDNHSVPTSRRFPKCSLCITSLIVYARTGGLTYPEVAHITSHHIHSNPICEFRVVQPSIFHDCATRTLA